MPAIKEKFKYEICTACACYVANGDIPEGLSKNALVLIDRGIASVDVFSVDSSDENGEPNEAYFSHSECELCGALPGDRVTATAVIWEN